MILPEKEITVFSPRGEEFVLPADATPVDFAYQLHTNLGHRAKSAIVNGKHVNLDHRLKSGEVVEIVSVEDQDFQPSRNWLTFVKTSKAKDAIRNYLRKQKRRKKIIAGREMLAEELAMFGMTARDIRGEQINDLLAETPWKSWEEILIAISEGSLTVREILKRIIGQKIYLYKSSSKEFNTGETRDSYANLSGILVKYAACCQPQKGDPIKGSIVQGQGITIHRSDCPCLISSPKEAVISIDFEIPKASNIKIKIEGRDRAGFINDITHIIAEEKVSLNEISTENGRPITKLILNVVLDNPDKLADFLKRLSEIEGVTSVTRL